MTDPTTDPAPVGPPLNPYGRRGALTDDLADRIVQVVAAGNYLRTAAQFAGIGQSTLMLWMAKGRAAAAVRDSGEEVPPEDRRYLVFMERVTQAETQAEVAAVTYWRRSFGEDWRAARDYLARKRPEQWAAKTTVTISSDEAEARIERATYEALTALGVDTDGMGLADLRDPEEPDEG